MKLRLIVLALGNFVIGTGSLVIAGILPKVSQQLQVSLTTAGQLVTIYALTYAISSPIMAAFTGKIPRRQLLVGALLLFTVANVLAALAPSFELLFAARIVAAFGGAIYTPTSSAVAVTLAPPAERGRALALVFSGLPVATVLGVPFGTFIGSNFGWRVAFWLVAGLGMVVSIALVIMIKSLAATAAIQLRQWLGLFKQKQLVATLSVTFMQYSAQFSAFTYIAALLQQNTGLDGTGVSFMLFVFGIAGVIGNTVGGYAADKWSIVRLLSFSLGILALVSFLLPIATLSVLGALLILPIWGFAGFIFNPLQQSRLIKFTPATPGLVLSLNSSMLYLGNATGAALGGLVVSVWSVQAIGWVSGFIALFACGLLALSVALGSGQAKLAVPVAES